MLMGCSPKTPSADWNYCKTGGLNLTAIYNYSDFGPSSLAGELLGFEWWQWNQHGDSDPEATYDIKVVVYAYGGKRAAMTHYVVHPSTNTDYRYVFYGEALRFLDDKITELDALTIEKDSDTFPELPAQLKDTKTRILTEVCDNLK